MKTIKARARAYAQTRNQNTYAYDGYLKGAIEQQAIDNVQLCEMILDNQDAVIDIALTAYCKTECPHVHDVCEKRCESYNRFKELLNNNVNEND